MRVPPGIDSAGVVADYGGGKQHERKFINNNDKMMTTRASKSCASHVAAVENVENLIVTAAASVTVSVRCR